MLQRKNVIVFDFDGTLSAGESSFGFLKYCFCHSIRPWLFLPYVIAGLVGRLFNKDGIWWRQTLRRFLTPQMIKKFGKDFIKQHKMNRFGWAKELVAKERSTGAKVLLISAGPDYLIPELVSDIKFDAVLTSITSSKKPWEYKFLCFGKNKVIAMDKWAREHKYIPNLVRTYSDSDVDMPIMRIAKERVWIDSKTGLRK